jgi:hypothetical protein
MQLIAEGYRTLRELEPEHPFSTYSHPAFEAEAVATGRRVVVKFHVRTCPLRPESARWYVELMRRAATHRAPNIVPVLGAGFTASDTWPWWAMEFVPGVVLEAELARGVTFAPARTAAIIEQLAAAATVARTADLAPALLSRHVILDGDHVWSWNFGVAAWSMRALDLVQGTFTTIGHRYINFEITPAQLRFLPSRPSDDAASLALIAFRMLAGRHYWNTAHAATPESFDIAPFMMELVGAREPPQRRTSTKLPSGFDAWFLACLAGEVASAADAARTLPRR